MAAEPAVRFFQLIPGAPLPELADPTIVGSASLRAYRFCEPFTAASGFGWYMFPPIDFDVVWDGHSIDWRSGASPWTQVRSVVLKDVVSVIKDGTGRQEVFPFLSNAPESGILQIWAGLIAKTAPAWSILVRPLANYPHDHAFDVLDGIIEADWWTGPLISPIRLVKSDRVIEFRKARPFAQLQLIPRESYSRSHRALKDVASYEMPTDVWNELGSTLASLADRTPGSYKKGVRQNRTKP